MVIDAPHDIGPDPAAGRPTAGYAPCCAPTRTTITSGWRRRWAPRSARRCCCIPTTSRCGARPTTAPPDGELADGQEIEVAGTTLTVLHTPGHAPGAVCFYAPDLATVFTGDTLFNGGPGATGRSFSDRPLLVTSIIDKLLALPGQTIVKTGHGDDTTIADEKDNLV